jgi:hypothetical protein
MSALDGTGFVVGEGTGDGNTVVVGSEVSGIVLSDPDGAVIHPAIITNTTSARETLKILMNTVDGNILIHLVVNIILFHPFNIFISTLHQTASSLFSLFLVVFDPKKTHHPQTVREYERLKSSLYPQAYKP